MRKVSMNLLAHGKHDLLHPVHITAEFSDLYFHRCRN